MVSFRTAVSIENVVRRGEAARHVFEGQSHAQYAGDPSVPETKEYFDEVTVANAYFVGAINRVGF